ncbi:NAD(P)H dehydrogenase (quinone) FQR1-like isoform X4 [Nymphaea colorata]|nr:NAD(P)H dehydrogenase (quinone) FQR1-like isoform X4 [Nymphaea colorata]
MEENRRALMLNAPFFSSRYYSMYGHVERLAEEIKKGADSVSGVEAFLWQVPETLPKEVLIKMNVPPRSEVPTIQPRQLVEADALIFGFPTRYGMMAAQFKAFMDATGGLWKEQALAGKPAGLFYSTGSQGGGQETTPNELSKSDRALDSLLHTYWQPTTVHAVWIRWSKADFLPVQK